MTALVTGGTGFVGSHIVRALLARGESVRCLARSESRLDNLEELAVEIVRGDLRNPTEVAEAVSGCRTVYHCAADYRLGLSDPSELYASNVGGTRIVLESAAEAGADRIVYTSSVGALGLRPDDQPANEETPVTQGKMIGHYKRSKFLAERVAEELASEGCPIVIVNPSTPVGELDIKPTPTGQIIVDFLRRKMPAYVDTGLNLIDVHDVAEGHLRAAERGEVGRRYILGNENLSLRDILLRLEAITGLRAPRVRLPHAVPFAFAAVSTLGARLLGRTPRVSFESVRMSTNRMYFDARRAREELGLPQTPVDGALRRAVDWFREHGYA